MNKTVLALIAALLALSACNTFNGMGQDMQSAGQWTSDSAQKVKNKMDSNSGN